MKLFIVFLTFFFSISAFALTVSSSAYNGSVKTVNYTDGSSATFTPTKSKDTWGTDNVTKTTTYTYADKTTYAVTSTVEPTVVKTIKGLVQTTTTTYGNKKKIVTTNTGVLVDGSQSVASNYSSKSGTYRFSDGSTSVISTTASGSPKVTWATDNVTKTTTYKYADKTTYAVTSTVEPTVSVTWKADNITKSSKYVYGNGKTSTVVQTVNPVLEKVYSAGMQSIVTTYGNGYVTTSTNTATSSPVSWASDHITKTTTYTFADGTTNPVVTTVASVTSGAILSASSGTNSTSPLITTFGDGFTVTLQDGSLAKQFQQSTLTSNNNTDPNAIVASTSETYDLRWGIKATPYILPTADDVKIRLVSTLAIINLRSSRFGSYPPISLNPNFDSISSSESTTSSLQGLWVNADVKSAWSNGWTGSGVKIGVIDDFTANDLSDFQSTNLPTSCENVSISGVIVNTCSTTKTLSIKLTHGEQVSMITGGSNSSLSGIIVEAGVWSDGFDIGTYTFGQNLNVSLSSPLFGVAKDAQIYRDDFLTYQSNTNGLFSQMKNWGVGGDSASQLYRQLKVVNLSLGGTGANPVRNAATYANQLAYANASVVPDAVFVKAAGNSSCIVSLTNCDPLNPVFYYSPQYKEKSLLVGALNQEGGSIASYSNMAGNYADRFLVADGRGIEKFDGSYDQGTSFAAPRVAGYAAIIRQKFPNLNAAKTSNIILDTATWNTRWGEKNTSTQAIYGQGEASLSRALAPVGRLR